MAAGFKKATVNASDVPATQTNFPSYVDLSRIGITTLAEAQSVRVYADSAKTTEWAREIVSATEMHVKVPSLTSSVEMFVDWDGVRADYAVTDTYGRNNVWSDYFMVVHQKSTVDATGGTTFTNNSDVAFGTSGGAFGNSGYGSYDGNDSLSRANISGYQPTTVTVQSWFRVASQSINTYPHLVNRMHATTPNGYRINLAYDGGTDHKAQMTVYAGGGYRTATTTSSYTVGAGTWFKCDGTYDGSNVRVYLNGSLEATTAYSGTISYGGTAPAFGLGQNQTGTTFALTGDMQESRARSGALSTNWLTSEYNNQSDEAGFWGTWSDVGGAIRPQFLGFAGI